MKRSVAVLVLVFVASACGGSADPPGGAPEPGPVPTTAVTPARAVDLTRSVVADLEARNEALYGD